MVHGLYCSVCRAPGKTALVNHLAECLEQELITVKCSDVLGKYVGESEKNVARLFRQAKEKNAILFLDEVDSLQSSRSSLTNQFEKQLVNEFLQQIEQSELTIFAASNHAQMIDKAALRRFDFKLTLDYLNQQQVLKLYQDVVGKISKEEQQQLIQMKQLTAGDFAIVARRNRLSRKPLTHVQNIQLLQEENNRKEKHQSIGFVQ
jgi:transitional endoplasmic reticulum ATPase